MERAISYPSSITFTVTFCWDLSLEESFASTITSYELSFPLSVGFSKSGVDLKVRAPVEEFISNLDASAPPFNDQVTDSSALKIWTALVPSSIDFELVEFPAEPLGPVITGLFPISIFEVVNDSEKLSLSLYEIFTFNFFPLSADELLYVFFVLTSSQFILSPEINQL